MHKPPRQGHASACSHDDARPRALGRQPRQAKIRCAKRSTTPSSRVGHDSHYAVELLRHRQRHDRQSSGEKQRPLYKTPRSDRRAASDDALAQSSRAHQRRSRTADPFGKAGSSPTRVGSLRKFHSHMQAAAVGRRVMEAEPLGWVKDRTATSRPDLRTRPKKMAAGRRSNRSDAQPITELPATTQWKDFGSTRAPWWRAGESKEPRSGARRRLKLRDGALSAPRSPSRRRAAMRSLRLPGLPPRRSPHETHSRRVRRCAPE